MTDGDYRFAPDGPGDEPAPGKGVKQEAMEGSFLFSGAGRYQPPPSYFLIRGDVESRGSLMKPGFLEVITYGNPPMEFHRRTATPRAGGGRWPNGLARAENPLTARVIVNRIWQPSLRPRHRRRRSTTSARWARRRPIPSCSTGWPSSSWTAAGASSDAPPDHDVGGLPDGVAIPGDGQRTRRTSCSGASACRGSTPKSCATAILAVSGALEPDGGRSARISADRSGDCGIDVGWHLEEGATDPLSGGAACTCIASEDFSFPLFEVFDLPNQNTIADGAILDRADAGPDFAERRVRAAAGEAIRRPCRKPRRTMPKQVDVAYRIALARPPRADEAELAVEFLRTPSLADFTHVLLNLNEFLYVR